jgi:hypothetical protein
MVNRTEECVDLSVGVWKETLQQEWMYMPQATAYPWKTGKHEKSIRMLRGAMKTHGDKWKGSQSNGVHEDGQAAYKLLQVEYHMPQKYQPPQEWMEGHIKDSRHCLHYRCVSVWWYYDQIVRDTPGFVNNFAPNSRASRQQKQGSQSSQQKPNRQHHRQQHHRQPPQYDNMQINLAEEAAHQRQLSLHHLEPEPHDDMFDIDGQAEMYDNQMPTQQKRLLGDWQFEIRRIKSGDTSKYYKETRAQAIEAAAANYEKYQDLGHPGIPDFLFTVKQPWSAGFGRANLAYDEDQVYKLGRKIQQLRETNAQLCQMEINMNGPAGQGSF